MLGKVTEECVVSESGKVPWFGIYGYGEVSSVTGPKGEAAISCVLLKKSLCSGSAGEVEPVGLPWRMELEDVPVKNGAGEVERYEVRDVFFGTTERPAGWLVKCTVGSETRSVTCTGEPSGNVENVSAGVPVEFDAKSLRLNCGTEKENGSQSGFMVFGSTEESKLLSAYGAPAGPQRASCDDWWRGGSDWLFGEVDGVCDGAGRENGILV